MKIFAIYTNLTLTEKPQWLDGFRRKYDKPYNFHNTLKQPCFIEEKKILELKNNTSLFFKSLKLKNHKIEIVFDEISTDKSKDGITIMLSSKGHSVLVDLQKDLINYLEQYKNYVKPKYQSYEENFNPHITIARNLSPDQFNEATKYLSGHYSCKGEITTVTLSIVDEVTPEEANNPLNQVNFLL